MKTGVRRSGSYQRVRWKRNSSRSSYQVKDFLFSNEGPKYCTHHQGYRRHDMPFIKANFRGGVRMVIPKWESWMVGRLRPPISVIVSSFFVLRQLSFAMARTHEQRGCRARALPDPGSVS